jgi:acyl-coenzyme A synthetase/AMP-(fatty) acid ligase
MHLLDQIHKRAAREPRRLALVFNGSPLSYGGFWRFIMGARASLAPHATGRGFALLWVDSLVECWVLDLALRSLGHDIAHIISREHFDLFENLDVALVITLASEGGKDVRAKPGVKHLVLSNPTAQRYSIDDPLPDPPSETHGVGGHIKLSSGTTGRFKMVVTHMGADAEGLARQAADYAQLGDRMVQPSESTVLNIFNLGLWNAGGYELPIFMWALGAAVVIEQSDAIERALAWPGVTRTSALPFQLAKLMALPEGAFPYLPQMQLAVGGGAVSPQLYRETARRLTPRIVTILGSTELGTWSMTPVESETDLRWNRINEGRRVEVIDEAGLPVAPGKLGRVRVARSERDAKTYVGEPAAGAEVFRDGWFYPGDLGVLNEAGRIALYGRDTDVVQLNGDKFPAEPWESEIRDKLGCEAVCVLSGNWRTGEEQLHVFAESRRPISQAELEQAIGSTVTGFGQVHAYLVEGLPRTATGKVRRGELAEMLYKGELPGGAAP